MSNLMETKIVIWTIGGSFAVATMLFVGKVAIAIHTGIELRVEAFWDGIIGEDGNLVKTLGGAIWDFIKGGIENGS